MKLLSIWTIAGLILASASHAQVGINRDNSDPDSSAMLDLKSADRGFLPPRMTFAQRNAISNPAEGLMVYCTNCRQDGSGTLSVYQNGQWKTLLYNCRPPVVPAPGTHESTVFVITWNWNTVPIAEGYKWNTVNNFFTATDMLNATTKTEAALSCQTNYTRFVWAYNDCGPSSPLTLNHTTQQIPLAVAPGEGTHIATSSQIAWNWTAVTGASGYRWNTTNNFATAVDLGTSLIKTETGLACNSLYTRYVWAYDTCGHSEASVLTDSTTVIPAAPSAGIQVPALYQITWNWNVSPGAMGYKWNTSEDYSTATDLANSLSKTEAGLPLGTPFTRFVWAYNACGGVSNALTLTSQTLTCDSVTVNHIAGSVAPVSRTVTYGTVMGIPGETAKCWITRNLGALVQADSVNAKDDLKAGWYWQFNRKQGFQLDGALRTPNTPWISLYNANSNWLADNDPCILLLGSPWRLPSNSEWYNVDSYGGWSNWYGPWGSGLKLHAAGYLYSGSGLLNSRGSIGYYWSSSQINSSTTNGTSLYFYSTACYAGMTLSKDSGFNLRCIREN